MKVRKILLKLLIIASVIYACIRLWHWKIGFTYFTQLSNIYTAVAVLLQLLSDRRATRLVKYTATVSILITGVVFGVVLAPMVPGGMLAAYRQDHYASLCLHFITPILTIADFLWNDTTGTWHKSDVWYGILPPTLYFVLILVLGAIGVEWRGMAAPYFFLNYHAPAGWFGYLPETADFSSSGIGVAYAVLAMIGAFLLSGWALLWLARRITKRKTNA